MKSPPAILGKIAESTLIRVAKAKEALSPEKLQEQIKSPTPSDYHHASNPLSPFSFSFQQTLSAPELSFICEIKKASPSKGIIAEDFPWLEIAKEYEEGGAAAISVLTEPEFFLGSDQYLREISAAVQIPTLRKDFIIDPYQIYEAKLWGAKAVLLICALLEPQELSDFIAIADELALDCLVEIHSEEEAQEALASGARIIGINNRDLVTFNMDTSLTARLRKLIPAKLSTGERILTVAESGIQTADDVRELKDSGVDAVLIGESLMRAPDRKGFLRELLAACK